MIRRIKKHTAETAIAFLAVLLLILFSALTSCATSRHSETRTESSGKISITEANLADSIARRIEYRSLEEAASAMETYTITIFDTSRKDTATGTYPIKATIHGTKQTDKTSVSSEISNDSVSVHAEGKTDIEGTVENDSESMSESATRPDMPARIGIFILVIGCAVAMPHIIRYVIKNII